MHQIFSGFHFYLVMLIVYVINHILVTVKLAQIRRNKLIFFGQFHPNSIHFTTCAKRRIFKPVTFFLAFFLTLFELMTFISI